MYACSKLLKIHSERHQADDDEENKPSSRNHFKRSWLTSSGASSWTQCPCPLSSMNDVFL